MGRRVKEVNAEGERKGTEKQMKGDEEDEDGMFEGKTGKGKRQQQSYFLSPPIFSLVGLQLRLVNPAFKD